MTTRTLAAPLFALGALAAPVARALARHAERRAARKALFEMNDAMLKDIGITRSEIEAALRGDVRRRR